MTKKTISHGLALLCGLMGILLGLTTCYSPGQVMPELVSEGTQQGEPTESTSALEEETQESLRLSVTELQVQRLSRQQIQISWNAPEDGAVETYLIKRQLACAQTGEWITVAEISAGQELRAVDELADSSICQYVYTVDVVPQDVTRYQVQEGAKVLASNLLVCLDPGHYLGVNQIKGESSYGYDEGFATLQIACTLRSELKERYGIETCMTREGDSITLGGYTDQELDNAHLGLRGTYAGEQGSDLFLSLHTNANLDNANGYETCMQPLSVNKPIILANTIAANDSAAIAVASGIGTELAKASYEAGTASVATFRTVEPGHLAFWSDLYNDSPDIQGSVYCRLQQDGSDYYGVLRAAAAEGVPGLIVEHGMHTVPQVRQAAMEGDLLTLWAEADARGIAQGFGFLTKDEIAYWTIVNKEDK